MRRECRERFPRDRGLAIPTSRHVRYARAVMHAASLITNGFLWSRWRGTRFRYSRRMCDPQEAHCTSIMLQLIHVFYDFDLFFTVNIHPQMLDYIYKADITFSEAC